MTLVITITQVMNCEKVLTLDLSQRQKSSFQTSISQSLGKYGSMYLRGETSRY